MNFNANRKKQQQKEEYCIGSMSIGNANKKSSVVIEL